MTQYSGPGSQQVHNSWNSYNDYWFYMLAQKGYIIVCVDGRGTGFKGADFKKVTYKELGKYEVEDQIDAAKVIGKYLMLMHLELEFGVGVMVDLCLVIVF